ncbi:MAG: FHA domain-containing protein [Deltaproteobacteria bacterium]|nr:FHA domain-containing protein [Deltaproteobacteria bacterium]
MTHDTAIRLSSYARDGASLSVKAFIAKHGEHFLARAMADGALKPTPEARDEHKTTHKIRLPGTDGEGDVRLDDPSSLYLYPIGDLSSPVGVGRAATNRVCIDDVSISAHHAELELKDGRIYVTDKGSTNGTWVGGRPTPFAAAVEVSFGKGIVFGDVGVTLLGAAQVVDFLELADFES